MAKLPQRLTAPLRVFLLQMCVAVHYSLHYPSHYLAANGLAMLNSVGIIITNYPHILATPGPTTSPLCQLVLAWPASFSPILADYDGQFFAEARLCLAYQLLATSNSFWLGPIVIFEMLQA